MAKKFNVARALKSDDKLSKPLERAVMYVFAELIYKPIFEILSEEISADWLEKELPKVIKERKTQKQDDLNEEIKRNREVYSYLYKNAKDPNDPNEGQNALIRAILRGRVQYTGEHFEGTFSIAVSRAIKAMGGTWDQRTKKWHIKRAQLSPQVSVAIGTASGLVQRTKERIGKHLDKLQELMENDPEFTFDKAFGTSLNTLEDRFEKGIEGITVAPEFTPEMLKNLAEKYSHNMNLYIKKWTKESIVRLRDRVLINTFQGKRAENLVSSIEHDFMVSATKAKFLAKQETSLLMSQFREERYKSAGVEKYRWLTAGDSRVRGYHKRLNGKIFTWDNPPVVDASGHRAHPGQDFNCRCVAVPLVE